MTDNPRLLDSRSFATLEQDLMKAVHDLEQAVKETEAARSRETHCRNTVNAIQKVIDARVEAMRNGAPRDTDWSIRQ